MKNKKKLITIGGMVKTFNVSTITLYKKYLPNLEPMFVKGRKKYYDFDEVMKIHQSLQVDIDGYEIVE